MEGADPTQVGFIDVPLLASGANGATYRLPAGTQLRIENADYFRSAPLDGDVPSLNLDVPVGGYFVALTDNRGASPPTWPLIRTSTDGTTDTVQATLDPLPSVIVFEQQTTPLTLQFHVSVAEPITFALGSIQVGVDVAETVATLYQLKLSGGSLDTDVALGEAAPAELATRLPVAGSTAQRYALTANTVSPWFVADPRTACARADLSIEAAGDAQFADLVRESQVPDQQQRICIVQFRPDLARISVVVARFGPATTSLLSDLGDRQYFTILEAFSDINTTLFDGTTLHLEGLAAGGPRRASVSISLNEITQDGVKRWLQLFAGGDGAATLAPL